jgi:uncharacterized tellurite resistance protein B-like protein
VGCIVAFPWMADPLAGLSASQRAQLRVLCWVACVDGEFAEEERILIRKLAARLLPHVDPADAVEALLAEQTTDLEAWVAELQDHDQCLALASLAFQMACSNTGAGDDGAINAAERVAYRRLLELLNLSDTEVQQAEWAGRQSLGATPGLLDRLNQLLFGWGAWPSVEALELSGTHWL